MGKRTPIYIMQKALDDPDIPKLYANAFECALGTRDVALFLRNADKTVGVVSLSYTVAKTLAIRLGDLISFLETKSRNTIMTSSDIEKALRPKPIKDRTLQ